MKSYYALSYNFCGIQQRLHIYRTADDFTAHFAELTAAFIGTGTDIVTHTVTAENDAEAVRKIKELYNWNE